MNEKVHTVFGVSMKDMVFACHVGRDEYVGNLQGFLGLSCGGERGFLVRVIHCWLILVFFCGGKM